MSETREISGVSLSAPGRTVLVTSTPSDSHTWNLVFLQLVLEEFRYIVRNIGACSAITTVLSECHGIRPDLVVVSSVNGHGRTEGAGLISALRGDPELRELPVVIGGVLTTGRTHPAEIETELIGLGYSGVFVGETALPDFRS